MTLTTSERPTALQARRPSRRRRAATSRPKPVIDPLAMLAHDLRGPLANLSLALESVGPSLPPDLLTRKLADAMRFVARIEDMVEDLIERRRTSGTAKSNLRAVPLVDLVSATLDANHPLAGRCNVTLEAAIAEDLSVRGDGRLLMRAIDNLVGNAIKHSPLGGRIFVRVARREGMAVIEIEDEGPGFTDDDLARAFQPYTRLSAVSSAPMPSTGLGLSIVKSIVEQHGGSVTAGRSARCTGALLTLTLPLAP